MSFRCFLPAWITAWATAVFLPSAIIAYRGLSTSAATIGTGLHRLPASTWQVADDVGPAVKLMIGGILLLGFLGLGRLRRIGPGAAMLVGLVAVGATLALIPPSLSRGFAQALTGTRFDGTTTPLYLLGGIGAGLVFAIGIARCRRASGRQ